MADRETAKTPEDITRLFVERSNAGDADGVAALYEPDAVMAFPPGQFTVGRDAIRELWARVLAQAPHFEPEAPLPTLISGDLALTSTPAEGRRRRPRPGCPPATRWFVATGARSAGVQEVASGRH